MGIFSDTIRVTVDVIAGQTQGFKGFLSGLKSDVGEAEGAFGKFKAAGAGAMSFVSDNAGALVAGAGTAIAAFAVSSVSDFQKVAGSVGDLRDTLGLSAEDASRWVEVAGDLGIGADKLETSMGKMLRTAGSSPGTFEKLGVEIARAKDGSVDANGTFLNVIDRLNGMEDPAQRAAAAQQLLGKSWMDSSELIGLGADGVKARLDEVSGAKIMSDDQIAQSREFRDAMDDLGDRVDNIKLQIAEGLVPILSTLAQTVGPVIDGFGMLRDAADKIGDIPFAGWITNNFIHPLDNLKTAFHLLPTDDEIHDWIFGQGASDISAELAISPETLASWDKQRAAGQALQLTTEENTAAYTEMGAGLHGLAVATEAYDKAASSSDWGKSELEGALTANENYSKQLFAMTDLAVQGESAIDDFGKSREGADGKVAAANLTLDAGTESGRKQIDALKGISQTLDTQFAAAYDAADGDMAQFMGRADKISNDTLNRLQSEFGLSKDQVDILRGSLGLTAQDWQARFEMSGTEEAQLKVGLLQGSIQSVTDKNWQAKIATLIASGDYVGVVNEVQDYFNRHPTTIRTTVSTANLSAAQMAAINAGRGGAIGGTIPREGMWTSEYGREFIDTSLGGGSAVVKPRAFSANLARGSGGGDIYVNVESGDPVKIAAAIDRVMWFRNAGPRKAA